tara:strand:+ start:6210 stop:7217 length:1008 start_codon:yes stop_codon:yes gene_type:complete
MKIAIVGAGAVGCYIGGCLAASGADVRFMGRARMRDRVLAQGLRMTDYAGRDQQVKSVDFVLDPAAVAGRDLVLVCVKSQHTADVAGQIRPHLAKDAVVISFQNGLGNAAALADGLGREVIAGMVGFNVAILDDGRIHQGTRGQLHVGDDRALMGCVRAFIAAGLPLIAHPDMRPVLWAKLMMNLNNPVNALAGIPLREQLLQRDFRACLALAQTEFLALAQAAGLPKLARLTPLPARALPWVLRLPTPVFRLAAASMLRIDAKARSSMADDLAQRKPTEVDWINGEVVRLAQGIGARAPVNQRLCALIHAAETAGQRPTWTAAALLAELRNAMR